MNLNFFLKLKNETNNYASSLSKAVTENDEILQTERRNASPSSNSKQKKEKPKQNFRVRKKNRVDHRLHHEWYL